MILVQHFHKGISLLNVRSKDGLSIHSLCYPEKKKQALCNCLQVIAEHFFHEGNFKVGDCFLQEAKIADGKAIREPYVAMHAILEQVPQSLLLWHFPMIVSIYIPADIIVQIISVYMRCCSS